MSSNRFFRYRLIFFGSRCVSCSLCGTYLTFSYAISIFLNRLLNDEISHDANKHCGEDDSFHLSKQISHASSNLHSLAQLH